MNCIVEGCTNDPRSPLTLKVGHICEEHWRKLPMAIRQAWWDETEYGKLDPSEELTKRIREHYNADNGKPSQAQNQSSPQ